MRKNSVLKDLPVDELICRVIVAEFDPVVLAHALGICLRTLEREFHETFGCAPERGIEIIRLNIGCALAGPGIRTKEIANCLCYHDASHFCHRFKAVFGRSIRLWSGAPAAFDNELIARLVPSLSLRDNLLELLVPPHKFTNALARTKTLQPSKRVPG